MQIIRAMTIDEKAAVGEKALQIMCGVSNMSLEEKRYWLEKIPKDYKYDNDMTIVKYRLWTELRNELIEQGILGVTKDISGQQKLDVSVITGGL